MEGIQFVVDGEGKTTAVIVDLARYGELLDDLFDIALSQHRLDAETCVPFEDAVSDIR
jgi:hypothetical protein